MELRDGMGRRITYLRMSVTDRCNNRCVYCMPPEGVELTSHDKILTLEEFAASAEKFARQFGIDKIRLTGGEPLLRRNIEWLVDKLANMPGVHDLAMTTNGAHLPDKAGTLYSAGLRRLNISLDSLRHDRYYEITRGGNLDEVLVGIEIAKKIGFAPIKINVVLLPGFDEESEFVKWGNENGYLIRFIEMMPGQHEITMNTGAPKMAEILSRLEPKFGEIKILDEPSEEGKHVFQYRITGRDWIFEIIPSVSNHFCDVCNRLRLNCQGHLRFCLFSDEVLDIRSLLQASDEVFAQAIIHFALRKKDSRKETLGSFMSSIGG